MQLLSSSSLTATVKKTIYMYMPDIYLTRVYSQRSGRIDAVEGIALAKVGAKAAS